MAEYIDRGTAIAKLTALEVTKPSATMADAKRLLADMPAADVAPVVHGRGRILAVTSGAALRAALSSPLRAVGISPAKKYCEDCGARMDSDESEAR